MENKRLVWNFEINTENPLNLNDMDTLEQDEVWWEARFFWPETAIITLHGMSENFLALSRCQIKQRQDTYYLLAHTDYNLKMRRDKLLYKPCLEKTAQAYAYSEKINLTAADSDSVLPGIAQYSAGMLRDLINRQGKAVLVEKEALIYQVATEPKTKLELAKLSVADKNYYSVSIESYSRTIIAMFTDRVLKKPPVSDYVHFLKKESGL